MKKLTFIFLLLMLSIFVGCVTIPESSDDALNRQQEQSMREANAQMGMPAIINFQERKLAKMIFELRDQENLITYAYIVAEMTGKLVFIGKCVGYGLPYSVQYTNPMKTNSSYRGGYEILPQADPNGLFMPEGLSATWLMLIDPKTNKPRPVYVEPQIIVSPFRLH